MKTEVGVLALLFVLIASGARAQSTKWDPGPAMKNAIMATNGVKWIDGRYLPIEGRAFNDVDEWYDRLPSGVTTNVNSG
ncbi:MAG: hypothetical protein IKC80_02965, partial [Kiritimatiellae bacterium]|nr:hypothetical protein [Kiritimatiellia bacterium]